MVFYYEESLSIKDIVHAESSVDPSVLRENFIVELLSQELFINIEYVADFLFLRQKTIILFKLEIVLVILLLKIEVILLLKL